MAQCALEFSGWLRKTNTPKVLRANIATYCSLQIQTSPPKAVDTLWVRNRILSLGQSSNPSRIKRESKAMGIVINVDNLVMIIFYWKYIGLYIFYVLFSIASSAFRTVPDTL